jgi:hypothetical protein
VVQGVSVWRNSGESTARLGLQRGGGHGGAEAARVAALRGAARRDWLQRKPPGANGVRASAARARQHRRGVGRRRAAQAAAGAGVHACVAAEPCAASPQICGAAAWLRRSPARRSGSRRLSWRGRRSSRQPGAAGAPCAARRCCTEDPSCERLRRRRLHGARRDRRGRGQGRAAGQGCATWATARTSSSAFGRHAIVSVQASRREGRTWRRCKLPTQDACDAGRWQWWCCAVRCGARRTAAA